MLVPRIFKLMFMLTAALVIFAQVPYLTSLTIGVLAGISLIFILIITGLYFNSKNLLVEACYKSKQDYCQHPTWYNVSSMCLNLVILIAMFTVSIPLAILYAVALFLSYAMLY